MCFGASSVAVDEDIEEDDDEDAASGSFLASREVKIYRKSIVFILSSPGSLAKSKMAERV